MATTLTFVDRCDYCAEISDCRWAQTLSGEQKVVCVECLGSTQVDRHLLPLVDE